MGETVARDTTGARGRAKARSGVQPTLPLLRRELAFATHDGERFALSWRIPRPRFQAIIVHGYGEHIARYEDVAHDLARAGGSVWGLDLRGHGRSEGERVLIEDFDAAVDDVHELVEIARGAEPGVPVVLIAHSLGGLIGARYAQRFPTELTGLVLSGPVIGEWSPITDLLDLAEVPSTPIDPATLSRDRLVGAIYAADPLVWHGDFRRETIRGIKDMLETITADGPPDPSPGDGPLPILWIHGEADPLVPIEPSRAGVAAFAPSGLTTRTYPGARHEILNETNRAEVLADVVRFIDGLIGEQ